MDSGTVFQGEVDESLEKVRTCIRVLRKFKDLYAHQKVAIVDMDPGKNIRPWDFKGEIIFAFYDAFLERVETIQVRKLVEREGMSKILVTGNEFGNESLIRMSFSKRMISGLGRPSSRREDRRFSRSRGFPWAIPAKMG